MKLHAYLSAGLVASILVTGWGARYCYNKAQEWHSRYRAALTEIQQQAGTISRMKLRQQSIAALDHKHTQELINAQKRISDLQHDVDAGRQRLQLHACASNVPGNQAASSACMDDAARPRLTDAAQRNYFILRQRIETARQQIASLQDYIRQQCHTE